MHKNLFYFNPVNGKTDLPRQAAKAFAQMEAGEKKVITETAGHFKKMQTTVIRTSEGGRFCRQITINNGMVQDKAGDILIV